MNFSEQQESSWSGLNKDDYNHTEPNDPYFSPEQASKRGPERHPTGYNFLGPGTEFPARMLGSDFYKQMMISAGRKPVGTEPYNIPINELDRCAYEHDAVFSRNNNTEKNIRDADVKFRECASKIKDANLLYYIQIQLAKNAIGLKEFAEDIGVISPGLFAYINKSVNDLNLTLAKNHTIPSTKEEQQEEDSNFYIGYLMLFFRLGANIILSGAQQLTTRQLIERTKNKNLINYIPNTLRPYLTNTAEFFMSREQARRISEVTIGAGQTLINYLLDSTDFFGLGVTGKLIQTIVEKIGYDKFANYLMDNSLLKISTSFASDSWRERNIMTKEELEKIIEGEDPEIFRAMVQRNRDMSNIIGYGLQNSRIIEITNLFRNIENLTKREKLSRFGNFYRAIIKIRGQKPGKILSAIYVLLNNSLRNQFVGDITLEKLREILNQKISNSDIDALFDSNFTNMLIDFLRPITPMTKISVRQYTYIEFIDMILNRLTITLTENALRDLLS